MFLFCEANFLIFLKLFFDGNDFTELGRYEYTLVSLENHPPILGSRN